MQEGSKWEVQLGFNPDNLAANKRYLRAEYTPDYWNTVTVYYVSVSPAEEGVSITVEKIKNNERITIFNKDITPIENDGTNLLLEVRPNWYKGFTHDFNEGEYMNKRLNFLFKDSVINVLIDMLKVNPPKDYLGQYSTKFENPKEALMAILSSNPPKKRRIIHTKLVCEILNSVEFYLIEGMELDGRFMGAVESYADKDFEIVEDIRELEADFVSRDLKTSIRKEKAEFYKVKDLSNPESDITELSAFMVDTIREEK